MAYGLVGLYGLFFLFVGAKGNAVPMKDEIGQDARGFFPWIMAILILRGLYSIDAIRPIIKPFMFLAVLTFFLKNYGTVTKQVNEITGLNLPLGK